MVRRTKTSKQKQIGSITQIRHLFITILVLIAVSYTQATSAQIKSIEVKKVACHHKDDHIQGFNLVITVERGDSVITTADSFFALDHFISLPDSVK